MPKAASPKPKPKAKTKKKTKLSVRGRLSLLIDPSSLHSCKEKTLHFIGVGRLKNNADLPGNKKTKSHSRRVPSSKRPKPAVCKHCGKVWKAANGRKAILRTCPECRMKRKIASGIKIHIPT